ncbi:efflux RND transporter periplasmic adaptor subunit [Lacrimispora sphenoides]|uniref:HlyD family secretion protein n=1 Tax=Lacrimispora sphenoides JCM 1415 TaxID=1297793 RepID=A0ABY1CDP5_9FIRM|nr:efflux RND transporter periplasmic adaptor subunit [Lacrimispora sphenoides]SET94920.1 HlyD family secretion protein [[Clostridium] sphenoides JCM 1415]SUY52639.1 RND family efflux transporter MFP subunit [Lacrimispora sphenoides]
MKIRMDGRKKRLCFLAAGIALALIIGNTAVKSFRGTPVQTAAASYEAVEDRYTEEGTITAGGEYRLVSEASGPVKEVKVRENDGVKAGDILFTVDDRDLLQEKSLCESALAGYQAKLEQSRIGQVMTSSPQEYLDSIRAEVSAKEADYQAAKTLIDASQSLYSAGSISRVEWEKDRASYEHASLAWEQAKSRYEESRRFLESLKAGGIDETTINGRFYDSVEEQLRAQIKSQETTMEQLDDKLKKCVVAADRDGIITSLPVKDMSYIQAGETAVTISGRGKIQAESDVLTSIAPYLTPGDKVTVILQLRNQDQMYGGTISQVYDYAAKGTSALGMDEYRVHVKIDMDENTELEGKEGYGANIRFTLYQGEHKLVIPSSAVFQLDDQNYVFVIKNGKAEKLPVEVEYKTSSQAVIKEGLAEGQKVIDHVDSEEIYEGAKVYAGS